MKKYYYLFLIILPVPLACEEAIDVELPTSDSRLVVDALIGFNENNDDPITIGQVKLTLTAPFLAEQVPVPENASVQIIHNTSGEIFEFLILL